MNPIFVVIAVFSVLGAIDRIIGNRFGLGKEFEKGLQMFGNLSLSMIGMIVLAPFLARLLSPAFDGLYAVFGIDPSVLPAMLFGNDMGGAALAASVAETPEFGTFNGLIVASMVGCTVSFTLPYAMEAVPADRRRPMMTGFLCGIVTIPVGCLVSGLCMGIPVLLLLLDLVPLLLLAAVIACGLWFAPNVSVRVFTVLGYVMRALITVGLVFGILQYLFGWSPVPDLAAIEDGALVCFNIAVVMTGVFPLLYLLRTALRRPLSAVSRKTGMANVSVVGFLATLATSVSTFGTMKEMDDRGVFFNSAFLISAGFTLADHLAFTMATDASVIGFVLLAKLTSGFAGVLLALLVDRRRQKKTAKETPEL